MAVDVSDFAGAGLEDDGSENLRIAAAAAGNGLTGGAGTALSVSPDVTTGATVCGLTVGANGAGVTVDNSSIAHTANSLNIGALGVTSSHLSATALAATKIPDWAAGSAGYGIPFVCGQTVTDAATYYIFNANSPFKFRIIDWWIHSLNATASNIKLYDGANDVSADTAKGGTDHALVRGGTLNNAYYEIIATTGTLAIVNSGAGAIADVYCMCVPVA